MNEIKNTLCPLCGASVTVDELGYHYQESEIYSGPMMYGYQTDHLQSVAELLRKHNIKPEELRDLMENFAKALEFARIEQAQIAERELKVFMDNFVEPMQEVVPEIIEKHFITRRRTDGL